MRPYLNRAGIAFLLLSAFSLGGCDFSVGNVPTPTSALTSLPVSTPRPVATSALLTPIAMRSPNVAAFRTALALLGTFSTPTPADSASPSEGQIAYISPEEYYKRGVADLEAGYMDAAIEELSQALMLDPNYAMAYALRGRAYSAKGKYKEALSDYSSSLKLQPDQADILYLRGTIYLSLVDYTRSLDDFRQVEKLGYSDSDLYYSYGLAYEWSGQPDMAIASYNQALDMLPGEDGYRGLVRAYTDKRDYALALSTATSALTDFPENASLYAERARVYMREGDSAKAQADLDSALNKTSNMSSTAYLIVVRGELEAEKGQTARAKSDAQKALGLTHDIVVQHMAALLLKSLVK